jgi:hypothetical protein
MAVARQVIDLRELLAARFPSSPRGKPAILPTGLAALDQVAGGLPKSAITEISSPHISAGSASLIHALIKKAHDQHQFLALIDGANSFDPQSLSNHWLRHLLWVRCTKTIEAMKTADLLLRDGNFPIVILDLVLNAPAELQKIAQTSWYRLQRLVESTSTVCLILSRHSLVSSARLKLLLQNSWKLADLTEDECRSELRFQVKRAHFKSAIS